MAPKIPQFSLQAETKRLMRDHQQDEQAENKKSRKILTTSKS
jgi:hypothetical protein